jgi:hypothetical protein
MTEHLRTNFVTKSAFGVSESIDITNQRGGQVVHSITHLAAGSYLIHVHEGKVVRCAEVVIGR